MEVELQYNGSWVAVKSISNRNRDHRIMTERDVGLCCSKRRGNISGVGCMPGSTEGRRGAIAPKLQFLAPPLMGWFH